MSELNSDPRVLAGQIREHLLSERAARLVKGETPFPKDFTSENPVLKQAAERSYAETLLSKRSNELTPVEIRFLTSHARQCLEHGDD
jgi:hypothetical protein